MTAASRTWAVVADVDALAVATRVAVLARQAGFDGAAASRFATAVSELIANAVKYAGGGSVTVRELPAGTPGLEAVVEDHGPGIADIAAAVGDGWSEGRRVDVEPIPRGRRGRGVGLGAVLRLADEVQLENLPAGGLRVSIRTRLRRPPVNSPAGRG